MGWESGYRDTRLGNLLDLLTKAKDSFVNAINELVRKTDWVDIREYGAIANDETKATANTAAIKSAITYAETVKKKVYIPSGDWFVNDTFTLTYSSLKGDGIAVSKLVFVNLGDTKDGIVINNVGVHNEIGVSGMSLLVKGLNGRTAVYTQKNSGQQTVYRTKHVFTDLFIGGYTYPASGTNNAYETIEAWACGLDIGDGFGAVVERVYGVGNYRVDTDPALQFKSVFIRLNASYTLLTSRISKITCANVYRGIELGDRVFFQISEFDIAHTWDGIYETATVPFDESRIFHGNINAQNKGLYLHDANNREVHGVTSRRHKSGWTGATHDWYGFHLVNSAGCWFTNNHAQPDETGVTFAGTQIGACFTASGTNAIHNFIVGATCDEGIRFDDCTGNNVLGTVTWQGTAVGASAKLYNLINNTRNAHFGHYTTVSTWQGTAYATDASIVKSGIKLETTASLT